MSAKTGSDLIAMAAYCVSDHSPNGKIVAFQHMSVGIFRVFRLENDLLFSQAKPFANRIVIEQCYNDIAMDWSGNPP